MGLPSVFTNTKCTWASTITSLSFVIIWFIKNEVLVIDLTNDLIVNSSSKCADFLYSMLHDLTIINELKVSLILLLLNPIENNASVLALSKKFR